MFCKLLTRVLPVILVAMLVGGCSSLDQHKFVSTVYVPKNIDVVNRITGQNLFHREIPVYHALTLDFDTGQEFELFSVNMRPARKMSYKLVNLETNERVDSGVMDMPGVPIIINMTVRKGPEYPPNYTDIYGDGEVVKNEYGQQVAMKKKPLYPSKPKVETTAPGSTPAPGSDAASEAPAAEEAAPAATVEESAEPAAEDAAEDAVEEVTPDAEPAASDQDKAQDVQEDDDTPEVPVIIIE